ncbi:hypothetical protein EK21DRAFT_90043 [Setomelanomma holmii]|uniref:Uncharacterized protein n=1 Tax=Setomelanomma holmii TaxID=210430 RepID=A0A9P4LKW1_9PLEO|nr:hypothetical protein EK21DRAFT_90043 [Setomelanomma holmii]
MAHPKMQQYSDQGTSASTEQRRLVTMASREQWAQVDPADPPNNAVSDSPPSPPSLVPGPAAFSALSPPRDASTPQSARQKRCTPLQPLNSTKLSPAPSQHHVSTARASISSSRAVRVEIPGSSRASARGSWPPSHLISPAGLAQVLVLLGLRVRRAIQPCVLSEGLVRTSLDRFQVRVPARPAIALPG